MYPIHLIGNAHIDPVWLWRWGEGLAEVKATFRSVLDRMEEFPSFTFTSACALYYRWIEESDLSMFNEIRARVEEGRWSLAGGFWVQPDCNLPSAESYARHALYSQRYFLSRFGRLARTGYCVDSFGHNGMLPQILRNAGMDRYVFMRPGDDEKRLPGNLFLWESPDGSRVTTFKIPFSYGDWFDDLLADPAYAGMSGNEAKVAATRKLEFAQGLPFMLFYGVGNHGGGPTVKSLKEWERLMVEQGLQYSTPDRFFDSLPQTLSLPVLRGDLQHHASGCYSANSAIKAANSRAESLLVDGELFMTAAHALGVGPYDGEEVQRAWEPVLFNQFHDILAGCTIKSAAEDALASYGEAMSRASRLMQHSLQRLSWAVDTSGPSNPVRSKENDWMLWGNPERGTPFVAFNSLSFPVRAALRVPSSIGVVKDHQDLSLDLQRVRGPQTNRNDKYEGLFMADLPPLGYSTFWLFKAPPPESQSAPISSSPLRLANEKLELLFDSSTGWIESIRDGSGGVELLSGPGAVPLVMDDSGADTWAHGITAFHHQVGRFTGTSCGFLESGPVRQVLRVQSAFSQSTLTQDFILYQGAPFVEVAARLELRERHRLVKLSFPLAQREAQVLYAMPYGFIAKAPDGQEEPSQRWAALKGQSSSVAGLCFALACDSKYSFDAVAEEGGTVLRMTVARSALYADHFGQRDGLGDYLDLGAQEFRYRIIPSCDCTLVQRHALELVHPPLGVVETYHSGALPRSSSGISIQENNVILDAFKRDEEARGTIIRLHECAGQPCQTTISLPWLHVSWSVRFRPMEVKTFFIADGTESPLETDFLERPKI